MVIAKIVILSGKCVWNKFTIHLYMCTQGMWFYLMWNTISETVRAFGLFLD